MILQTVAFKIPNKEIERGAAGDPNTKFYTNWDSDRKTFTVCYL